MSEAHPDVIKIGTDALRSAGIAMTIDGCGCCGSPRVRMSVDGQTVFDADDVVFDMHDDGAELPVAKPADVAKGPSPAEAKAAMLEVLRGQEAFDAIQDLSGLLDRLFIAANEGRAERPDDDDLMAQVYEGAMGTPPELEVLLS